MAGGDMVSFALSTIAPLHKIILRYALVLTSTTVRGP